MINLFVLQLKLNTMRSQKCYFHNIFITLTKQTPIGRLLQVFNLNLPLKLFFYILVTVSNNLPHKICYENVVNITCLRLTKIKIIL